MSKILRMADMVKGVYNILHDEKGSAHNPHSLRLSLRYDVTLKDVMLGYTLKKRTSPVMVLT